MSLTLSFHAIHELLRTQTHRQLLFLWNVSMVYRKTGYLDSLVTLFSTSPFQILIVVEITEYVVYTHAYAGDGKHA